MLLMDWDNDTGRKMIWSEIREQGIQIPDIGRVEIVMSCLRSQMVIKPGIEWHPEGQTTFDGGRSFIVTEVSCDPDIVLPSGTLVTLTHQRVKFEGGSWYIGTTAELYIPRDLEFEG